MAAKQNKLLNKINQGDCVKLMTCLADESIDLAFADPPFNIGYEYDEYNDRLESEQYLDWSVEWMKQVHRVLKPTGAFWLAIGDEYAAELKVEALKLGFECRSWVIWYYTFGVHCTHKFTRSHAHLFYFVKDAKQWTFNSGEVKVPSARQLVYNDSRAAKGGRMPDDTWILRPQDCLDGFSPDEDTWYFPRVAGTFKERAGFHGCQMPEQLLGRIIKACSNPGETVLDPFSGSATTLAVAKKLERQFIGLELSKEYSVLGRRRLDSINEGDDLDGSPEPNASAPQTNAKKRTGARAKKRPSISQVDDHQKELFSNTTGAPSRSRLEADGLIDSFSCIHRGHSVDRVVADPVLNEDFQLACDRRQIPGTAAERNRFLFRLRKSGRLKQAGVETSVRTQVSWDDLELFIFASEIAWRRISDDYGNMSLDDILCDPRIASQFDVIAQQFAPGFRPVDYRWGAIKLRKEGRNARRRAENYRQKLSIQKFTDGVRLSELDLAKVPVTAGVYGIATDTGEFLFAAETRGLAARLKAHFASAERRKGWLREQEDLTVFYHNLETIADYRLARQSLLLKWHRPKWNMVAKLAV
ncbi:MAG: site-specific DNA-methyltransferase [Mariniblastus sp.]|nr:site-specific DNA-methyltransferase [Mariniblastus sp.]